MVFSTLPVNLQNILIENFNFLYKSAIILFFIISSLVLIVNFKPKNSKYIFVKQIRTVYYIMAWIIISTIPFHIGYLSPRVSLSTVLNFMILFYTLNFIILGVVITLNVIKYGTDFIIELFTNEKKTNPIKSELVKYFGEKYM